MPARKPRVRSEKRTERDFKGHFCAADDCHFFRTTDLNDKWRVSTIGDYHPMGGGRTEVGCGRTYETMVFPLGKEKCPCGCGARLISEWTERDSNGYTSEAAALAGHEAMVAKYLPLPRGD